DDDTENPLEHQPPRVAGWMGVATSDRPPTGDATTKGRSGAWKWGSAAGAAVGLTGSAFMVGRGGQQQDARAQASAAGGNPNSAGVRALQDGYSANRTWGTLTLLGGGALAITSVTLFILDGRLQAPQRAHLTAMMGPGGAALGIEGAF